jgi:glycosyltransferase involved in cell wall biosynthesis
VEHPQNLGYGRSLKSGILNATHDLIAITDADGTYPVERLPELIGLAEKFDMVVGRRTGSAYAGSLPKRMGRVVFRLLGEFATGRRIPDINSGLRVFRRRQVLPFFPHISSGFSFTTTVTLVYLLNGMFVHYVPIEYRPRTGPTKVRHFRDTLRALQIVVEAILRCNPIKVFLLMAAPFVIASMILFGAAAYAGWWGYAVLAVLMLHTGTMVLALGFLAVSALSRPGEHADAFRTGAAGPGGRGAQFAETLSE